MAQPAQATIQQSVSRTETDFSRQAFCIQHFGFSAAPILFGLDKFLNLMTTWDKYLAPWIVRIVGNAHGFMYGIGGTEIVAGILVWFKPRWGSYVVALWLLRNHR